MLRPPRRPSRASAQAPLQSGEAEELRRSEQPAAYDRPFWLAYVSNLFVSSAIALLYRYADFVSLLGGTEFHLGWIVGIGMVGSLAMRLVLGSWIDRYGAGLLWLGSLLLFAVTCLVHLAIASHTGAAIYLLRIAYCCAVAGLGGASTTFVSMRTPNYRLAEVVGMFGTAGFLGVVVGTVLGDFLFSSIAVASVQVAEMFIVAAVLGFLAIPFAWAAGRGSGFKVQSSETTNRQIGRSANLRISKSANLQVCKSPNSSEPSQLAILRRYSPGMILVIVVTMGMALGLPSTFLRTYATDQGIPRIGLFFLVYCIAAVVIRVPTRRWSERFGPRPIILGGMAGMTASVAIFPLVHSEWQLALPAVGFGCSHGVLWPAVLAAGSVAFPPKNRGLATILLLAAWDMGLFVASPSVGVILSYAHSIGLPPYPTMFLSMAGLLTVVTLWYAATRSKALPEAASERKREQKAA